MPLESLRRPLSPISLESRWNANYRYDERYATNSVQGRSWTTDEWYSRSRERARGHLDKILALDRNARGPVLDLGCGSNGPFLREAARRGLDAVGLDLSAEAIRRLDERIRAEKLSEKCRLQTGRFDVRIEAEDATFGIVVSTGAVCHTSRIMDALREVSRVARPGASVMMTPFLNWRHPDHLMYQAIDWCKNRVEPWWREDPPRVPFCYVGHRELLDLFAGAGLQILRVEETCGLDPFHLTLSHGPRASALLDRLNATWPLARITRYWTLFARKV